MSDKNKKQKTRNSLVKVMMKRHHGTQIHKDKREKRKNNPKRNWRSEWE